MQPTEIDARPIAVPPNFSPGETYIPGKGYFSLLMPEIIPLAIHSSVPMVLKGVSGPAALTLPGSW